MFRLSLRKFPIFTAWMVGPLIVRQESQTMEKWKFSKDSNRSDIRRARYLQHCSFDQHRISTLLHIFGFAFHEKMESIILSNEATWYLLETEI